MIIRPATRDDVPRIGRIFLDARAKATPWLPVLHIEDTMRALPSGFTLWTHQGNERARSFYEKHGLRAIQFTDGSTNEERMPDVQYEWRSPSG